MVMVKAKVGMKIMMVVVDNAMVMGKEGGS